MVVGTPDYLALEQVLNAHQVDIRADLYSLGCTLYFLLTGRPPFAGGTLAETLLNHQMEQAVPVDRLRPEVPADVAAVVKALMSKRPEDRSQTPSELVAVLTPLAGGGVNGLAVSPDGWYVLCCGDNGTATYRELTRSTRHAASLSRRTHRSERATG